MLLNKSVILSLFLSLLLTACSGSDGFGVGNGNDDSSVDPDASTDDDTDTDTDPVSTVDPRLGTGSGVTFSLGAVAAADTSLSYGGSTTVTVNVVDANASNALVQTPTSVVFSSACATSGLATIGSGNADTATVVSSAGTATVNYSATSCSGSDTITATLESSTTTVASVTFTISSLDLGTGVAGTFVSGGMTTSTGASDLSYGGDTVVSVNVVDSADNSLFDSSAVTVSFTSNCVLTGQSAIDSSVNTTTGTAVATYSATTCEGADVITATLSDGTTATANITVAGQVLGALEFVAASPVTIALSGSGSSANPEVSTVSFSLKDKTGEAMAGETITYTLSTEVGGISLSSPSSVTDAEGITSVQLNAGGVNVSVVVIGTVVVTNDDGSTSTTTTTSDPIAILGGIPDQNSFTLAVTTLNPRAWEFVGTNTIFSVRAADRYNNQARDGTQISFVTNGGAIVGSCALSEGACSVNWTGQNPRPAGGLAKILARTTGEESFTDSNSNGIYDVGEVVLTNLDEAFLDVDGDGTRNNDNEFFSDFNNNGAFDTKVGTNFQGTNCSDAAEAAGHCANLVDVRDSGTICMSSDSVVATIFDADAPASGDYSDGFIEVEDFDLRVLLGEEEPKVFEFTFRDSANGIMPASGTTIATSIEGGKIVSGGTMVVPNACSDGNGNALIMTRSIAIETDDDTDTSGLLKITVTEVDGDVYDYTVILN